MNCNDVIQQLNKMCSESYKNNVIKLGIPEKNCLGVSTGDIRKLAKSLPKSNELAFDLWKTGYHEAKILSVLVFDKKTISIEQIIPLMKEVYSWDLCDHLCKNLLLNMEGYQKLIFEWCKLESTYYKRAAFTLIAATAINANKLPEEVVVQYLQLIKENSCDETEHVKKAVSWALREIRKERL